MSDPSEAYFAQDLEAMDQAENYFDWIFEGFGPYIGKDILEVGAGTGNLSRRLLKFKPDRVVGVEPSSNVYHILEQRLGTEPGFTPVRGCLSDHHAKWQRAFDTVMYVNVMEHVEKDREEVELASSCLRAGGHLLIFVPAQPWLYGSADELFGHYRRYTKESLSALLPADDWEVIDLRYFDVLGMLPWWVSFVLLRSKKMSPGGVKLYDRYAVPLMRRVESIAPPAVGKNLLLVARRKG